MNKDSFILYTKQKEVIDKLTDEQAGKLIKAIYEYVQTGETPELDAILDIAFTPIKQILDENAEKYKRTVQKNKENIAKRWNKNNTKNTSGTNGKKQNTKNTDNEYDNEYEYEYDTDTDDDNNEKTAAVDSCIDGLQKIKDFYNNNIGLVTPYAHEVFADYLQEMPPDLIILAIKKSVEANKRTLQYIKAILNNWSKSGIKTVIEAEEKSKKYKKNKGKKEANYEQREYENLDYLYSNEGVSEDEQRN